jgi:hypothetical protein
MARLSLTRSSEAAADRLGAVTACGNGTYCCGAEEEAGTCDCATKKGTFTLADGVFQGVVSLAAPYVTQTPTPSPSSTSSSTMKSSLSSSVTSTSTSSSTSSPAPRHSGHSHTNKKVGIALGVVFGSAAVLALVWFLFVRHKRHRYYQERFSRANANERHPDYREERNSIEIPQYPPVNGNAGPKTVVHTGSENRAGMGFAPAPRDNAYEAGRAARQQRTTDDRMSRSTMGSIPRRAVSGDRYFQQQNTSRNLSELDGYGI